MIPILKLTDDQLRQDLARVADDASAIHVNPAHVLAALQECLDKRTTPPVQERIAMALERIADRLDAWDAGSEHGALYVTGSVETST